MTGRLGFMCRGPLVLAAAVVGLAGRGLPAAGEGFTYHIPFEKPMSWSGVMLPWGGDGYLDWVIADGGKEGKALRITSALRKRAVTSEIRSLMFNHEPETSARIQLDIKPVAHPTGSLFMIRWFDGYVTTEAFEKSADDALAPFPSPIYQCSTQPEDQGWHHMDFRTPRLKHTILTIAFMISQPPDPSKGEQDQFIDYLLDNLRVETVPLSEYMDPGFDWHGKGGGKMNDWRWTTGGAHVDWCDFMDEVEAPWGDDRTIPYGLTSFRDTGSRLLHMKHNYAHDTVNTRVGGASVIALVRRDPADAPASWGIRQTVSYAAFGLGPEEDAHLEVTIKYAFQQEGEEKRARLQVGCDPEGGTLTENALWSEENPDVNWKDGQWRTARLEFDRPKGAAALTVFFRCRDGVVGKDGRARATVGVGRAIADWIIVKATKK